MGASARFAAALGVSAYQRREPERTALYRTVLQHLDAFLAATELPRHVTRTLRRYLDCGILAKGFLRVKCHACEQESLVAFSCKDRSFCPSCTARRSAQTAAHLMEAVLPPVPLRQFVLAMPPDLHHRLARNPELETQTLAIFLDELRGCLQSTAGANGAPGFVTFLQHFGSILNLHVHFHVLALDGVYAREDVEPPEFLPSREPTQAELESLVTRVARRVRRLAGDTDPDEVPAVEAPVLKLLGADPVERRPAKKLTAEYDGFNLHAATHFAAHERQAVERFCRYAARGPLAMSRLSLAPNGNVVYRLKTPRADGTSHVVFTPRSLLTRLSWLVVQPRMHLTRYHGVLAPNHPWRNLVVPKPIVRLAGQPRCQRAAVDWATLLRRVFAIEVLLCACGGQRRIIAQIEPGPVARKILAHLGLPVSPPRPTQGVLFQTGPPDQDGPEAHGPWSDSDFDQRLPHDALPA
jgi:hypothetical protein